MSDFKALFKQAQASRGSALPGKDALKILKAQKAAAKAAAEKAPPSADQRLSSAAASGVTSSSQTSAPSAPNSEKTATDFVEAAAGSAIAAPSGLPADFFQPSGPSASSTAASSKSGPPPHAPTSGRAPAAGAAAGSGTAAIPQGFFSNKEDDAKARGVKLPDKADKEREYKEYVRKIEEELASAAAAEEVEAADASHDREVREAYEHLVRLQRIDALGKRGAPVHPAGSTDGVLALSDVPSTDGTAAAAGAPLQLHVPKRRRVIDALQAIMSGRGEAEEEEEEGSDDPGMLDWRAKAV